MLSAHYVLGTGLNALYEPSDFTLKTTWELVINNRAPFTGEEI